MKKMKVLALVLAAIMVLALLPAISFADGLENGWYLAGTFNGWQAAEGWKLTSFDNINDFETDVVYLQQGQQYKIAYYKNGAWEDGSWYPSSDVPVDETGYYVIKFNQISKNIQANKIYDVATPPSFNAKHSLTLSGDLGLNFFVNPGTWNLYNNDDDRAVVVFTIYKANGIDVLETKDWKMYKGIATKEIDNARCRCFTCPVNVIQMAQSIKAELKWWNGTGYDTTKGDNGVIATQTYSVQEYFQTAAAALTADPISYDSATKNLIKATYVYGVRLQQFLIWKNALTEYNAMDATIFGDIAGISYTGYKSNAPEVPLPDNTVNSIGKNNDWEALFSTTQYQLVLDSKTTLRLYITPNYDLTTLYVGPTQYPDVLSKKANPGAGEEGINNYMTYSGGTAANEEKVFTILNIPAHELLTVYTLTANENGTYKPQAWFSAAYYAMSMKQFATGLSYGSDDYNYWMNAADALLGYAEYAYTYTHSAYYYE